MAPSDPEPAVEGDVIDLASARKHGPLDPELARFLSDGLLGGGGFETAVRSMTDRMSAMSQDALNTMSPEEYNDQVLSGGSLEERLALTELQSAFAKYGYAPRNSVEFVAKAAEVFRVLYQNNELLPVETRLKAATISQDLAIVEKNADLVLHTSHARAQLAQIEARTDLQVATITSPTKVTEAEVAGKEKSVELTGRSRTADIARSVLNTEKQAELIEKRVRSMRRLRNAVVKEFINPILGWTIKWTLIIGVPLVIISVVVAGQPQYSNVPILGPVNAWWQSIFTPIHDGVVRLLNQPSQPR